MLLCWRHQQWCLRLRWKVSEAARPGPAANQLHGKRPTGIQELNGGQHTGANPNEFQLAPQHAMLDSVTCLLQVHKAGTGGALGNASVADELKQGEDVMDGGLARPEACLSRAAQLMLL